MNKKIDQKSMREAEERFLCFLSSFLLCKIFLKIFLKEARDYA